MCLHVKFYIFKSFKKRGAFPLSSLDCVSDCMYATFSDYEFHSWVPFCWHPTRSLLIPSLYVSINNENGEMIPNSYLNTVLFSRTHFFF